MTRSENELVRRNASEVRRSTPPSRDWSQGPGPSQASCRAPHAGRTVTDESKLRLFSALALTWAAWKAEDSAVACLPQFPLCRCRRALHAHGSRRVALGARRVLQSRTAETRVRVKVV